MTPHESGDEQGALIAAAGCVCLFVCELLLLLLLQLIVATGKARGPWVPDVLPRLGSSLPGVFLQGLLIADRDGNILHSRWGLLGTGRGV